MIDIVINGKVVKTVATLQEAEKFKAEYLNGNYNVIGGFSTETPDADYNEYRELQQEALYE